MSGKTKLYDLDVSKKTYLKDTYIDGAHGCGLTVDGIHTGGTRQLRKDFEGSDEIVGESFSVIPGLEASFFVPEGCSRVYRITCIAEVVDDVTRPQCFDKEDTKNDKCSEIDAKMPSDCNVYEKDKKGNKYNCAYKKKGSKEFCVVGPRCESDYGHRRRLLTKPPPPKPLRDINNHLFEVAVFIDDKQSVDAQNNPVSNSQTLQDRTPYRGEFHPKAGHRRLLDRRSRRSRRVRRDDDEDLSQPVVATVTNDILVKLHTGYHTVECQGRDVISDQDNRGRHGGRRLLDWDEGQDADDLTTDHELRYIPAGTRLLIEENVHVPLTESKKKGYKGYKGKGKY